MIPDILNTFVHALQADLRGTHIAVQQLPARSYLKQHWAIVINHSMVYSVWQTHNLEWWWSDAKQTHQNLNSVSTTKERLVN